MKIDFKHLSPKWKAPGNEPNDEMKRNGFQAGYKPPASIFNWFWSAVSNCIDELHDILSSFSEEYNEHKHSASDITSGILPIAHGGTGATTAMKALKNLGINVTAEVINLLDGMTENIQTQLNGKSSTSHTHDSATDKTAGFMAADDKKILDLMWKFINKQMSEFSSFYITFADGVSQASDFAPTSTVQIRNIGNKVQLRGKVTFTMGSGTTDILSFPTDKYPVPDRSNVYKLVPCTGGYIAKIFVRPNGSIACDRISLPGSNTPVTGNITWLQLDMEWDTE